jgi:hypothetical protein
LGLVFSGGGGTGVPSYGVNVSILTSNATTLGQLRGPFVDVGASGGQIITAGGDYQTGLDSNNKLINVDTVGPGVGVRIPDTPVVPIGVEIHGGATDTVTWQLVSW